MAKTSINWHPADIKAALSKRGATVAQVARKAGIHETTVSKALRHPCLTGERAIAAFLETHPKVIWPARYDNDGNPRHARSHLQLNVLDTMQSSQKCVPA